MLLAGTKLLGHLRKVFSIEETEEAPLENEEIDTTDMPVLESEESTSTRTKNINTKPNG